MMISDEHDYSDDGDDKDHRTSFLIVIVDVHDDDQVMIHDDLKESLRV